MTVEFIRAFRCYEAGQRAEVRDSIGRTWVEHGLAKEIEHECSVQENKRFKKNAQQSI